MLQLFGGISHISLTGVALDNGEEPAVPFPLQLGVATLDIHRGAVDPLLDSLELCLATDTALHTLVVRDIHMDNISRVNSFLNITGPHFTHFGWSIPFDPDMSLSIRFMADRGIDIVNLEPCINLRRLSLWMYWDDSAFPTANRFALEYLLEVLSRLPFEKSPLRLDQLRLILSLRPLSHTAAHDSLEGARPRLRPVEDKLLGWVEQRVLHGVFEHSDKAALIVCSIVCRQWRSMSTPYVFHNITVSCKPIDPQGRGPFQGMFLHKQPEKTLSCFLQFLHQSPYIASQIHELKVTMFYAHDGPTYFYDSDADYSAFVGALRLLPQLRNLTIRDLLLRNEQLVVLPDVKLQKLTVCYIDRSSGCIEFHINDLLRMLRLFGSVEEITLAGLPFGSDSGEPISPFPVQRELTSLVLLEAHGHSALIQSIELGLTAEPHQVNVSNLTIRDFCTDDVPEVNSLLNTTGPQYFHLGCSIPIDIWNGKCPDHTLRFRLISARLTEQHDVLDLAHCNGLRSLSIRMRLSQFKYGPLSWQYLFKVLNSLPFENTSLFLAKFLLIFGFERGDHNNVREDLGRVHSYFKILEDRLLGWVERRVVQGVRVELVEFLGERETVDASFVSEFLPRLHAAGVLSLGQ
ncbi:hypothetical protein EIP86_004157 [Pleurotus ostreatoroseus]|nr:hypothetical protein EIP86_004157 [Pleurotus ostreatoroseus]